jgi:hypothetical protein
MILEKLSTGFVIKTRRSAMKRLDRFEKLTDFLKTGIQRSVSIFTRAARACNARAGLHSALLLLLLLLWRGMLCSIIANFVMVASQVVVCRVNIRVNLRRVTLIRYARPAV